MTDVSEIGLTGDQETDQQNLDGFVDDISVVSGIFGWAHDPKNPKRQVTVALNVGGKTIATTKTGLQRADVAEVLNGAGEFFGFHFPLDVFGSFADIPNALMAEPLVVSIVETGVVILAANPMPSASECLFQVWQKEKKTRFDHQNEDVAELKKSLNAKFRDAYGGLQNLPSLKSNGVAASIGMIGLIRRHVYLIAGRIEAGKLPSECSGIIESNQRHQPFGAVFLEYDNKSSTPDMINFVGLVETRWQPSPNAPCPEMLVFTDDGPLRIKAGSQITELPPQQSCQLVRSLPAANALEPDRHAAISGYVETQNNWEMVPDEGFKLGLDQMLFMPGFGLFIEGWLLPTSKSVTDIQVRFDNRILSVDSMSFFRKERHDLAGIDGVTQSDLEMAGFVGACRMENGFKAVNLALIKFTFEDDTSFVAEIPRDRIKPISNLRGIGAIQQLYSNLHVEKFRPEMKVAIARIAGDTSRVEVLSAKPTTNSLVIELPQDRSDCALVLGRLDRMRRKSKEDIGISLIIDDAAPRDVLLPWLQMMERYRNDISLFRVRGGHVFPLLPALVRQTKSKSVLFCRQEFLPDLDAFDLFARRDLGDDNPVALQACSDGITLPEIGMFMARSSTLAPLVAQVGGRLDGNYLMEVFRVAQPALAREGCQALKYCSGFKPERLALFDGYDNIIELERASS
ncbi:hypothetical protein Q8W37_05680 [Shimia thalassica]|uniref:hypothetical protein n=1 Tax=Shimia thalassica TaxID=1715693 RepID=UPI0027374594|nr:hypothetical protein [Shimia thalassica]MDP2579412.1 hypothetical protein [Shimia thalassica]